MAQSVHTNGPVTASSHNQPFYLFLGGEWINLTLYQGWVQMPVQKQHVWGDFWGDNGGLCDEPT
jgi:hypothetical protein